MRTYAEEWDLYKEHGIPKQVLNNPVILKLVQNTFYAGLWAAHTKLTLELTNYPDEIAEHHLEQLSEEIHSAFLGGHLKKEKANGQ